MRPTTQMSDCRGGRWRSPWAAAAKKIVRTRRTQRSLESLDTWQLGGFRVHVVPRTRRRAGRRRPSAGRRRGWGPAAQRGFQVR